MMMESQPHSRRYFLGLGAAVPALVLAGGLLAPSAAQAADSDQMRPPLGGRKPEPSYRPATEILMFC
jgi:hypothetical protein